MIIINAINSDTFLTVLWLIGLLAFLHRLLLAYHSEYTIRSRWDNLLMSFTLLGAATYLFAARFDLFPSHEWLTTISRSVWMWILLSSIYTGHREAMRIFRARELYRETIGKRAENGFNKAVRAIAKMSEDGPE